MSQGNMLITIIAFMFLTTILLNFYRLLADNGDTIANSQDGILETTLATSYLEVAAGLAFDSNTDTSDVAIRNPSALSATLGRESGGEDSIYDFNEIGPMRPGSLTRQYKDPQHHTGAYWQISYTRRMKSRTEYVRREWVKDVRRQIASHKRFKSLVEQWIDLSIEHSHLTMQVAEPKAT